MLPTAGLTSHIDVALIAIYVFWAFFFGLVYWLRREDQREGYLLESNKGDLLDIVVPPVPPAKTYLLPDGTTKQAPDGIPDDRPVPATPTAPWEGAPLAPTGNPLRDGIGAASYAMRRDEPEKDHNGLPKIQPMRALNDVGIVEDDPDPRGMPVVTRGGKIIGTVKDAWIDRAEQLIRYYEVEVKGETPYSVLVPVQFANVNGYKGSVLVTVIGPEHFAVLPRTKSPDVVTKLEEDKIVGFFAGAPLYASPTLATVAS